MIKTLPIIILPFIVTLTGLSMLRRSELYDEFTAGIREGIKSAVSLLPGLIGLMTAVGIFNASGAPEMLGTLLAPIFGRFGIPPELASMLVMRPVSGAASSAVFDSLLASYGPDSYIGRCASVIVGSSDTIVYICAIYFASVGVKKSGSAPLIAVIVMIFTVILSCGVVRLYFGC